MSNNISPDGFNASEVQVAISDNGDAIIVWRMNIAWGSLCGSVTFQCARIFMSEYRDGAWSHPTDMDAFIDPANTNNVSTTPRVAIDNNGNTIIVWRNFAGGIYKSEYRDGGPWDHPDTINDDIPNSYWNPTVAMDDNGNALIVWQGVDSAFNNRIYLSEYRNGIWTHPADLDNDAINPAGQACTGITCAIPVKIAMDNNDNAIIVWDQRTSAYTEFEDGVIYKSEYRNDAWTHPANLNDTINPGVMTDWARFPEVAMDDNDNAIIIWGQNDETLDCEVRPPGWFSTIPGPCKQLFMSEYRDGSWTNPLNLSDHISVTGQPVRTINGLKNYSVAMGNSGESIIAWAQNIPSDFCGEAPSQTVFVSEYRGGGWKHPTNLNDNLIDLEIRSLSPQAVMDNTGNILLGWNSTNGIFISEYRCPGCEQDLPEIIAPRSLVATIGDGQVSLAWHEVSDAHSYNIYWSTTGVATTSDNKISGVVGGEYLHTELINKTTYSYLVTAVHPGGESATSNNVSVRPSACPGCEPILAETSLLGGTSTDEGKAIRLDSDGNVYVAGSTWGDLAGTSNGSSDAFISKHTPDGSGDWTIQIGTTGFESANGIAIDDEGNSYITGDGILLSKYKPDGSLDETWPELSAAATGKAVAIDPMGNVYITGSTSADLDFPDTYTPYGGLDIFISKYNSSGVLQWTVQPGTTEHEQGNSIVVDAQGNVYVTGYTKGGLDGNTHDGPTTQEDVFITKYNTNGGRLWTEQVDPNTTNSAKEVGYGIALDAQNNVYITGYTSGKLFNNNQRGRYDVFVMKYDTDGCRKWTRQYGNNRNLYDAFTYGYGIAVDNDENVLVTGETQGALHDNLYAGEKDIFVMKLTSKGALAWTKQYGEDNMDYGNAIAVNAAGNIFTTGVTDGNLEGQENNGDGSAYNYDAFLMRHDSLD